VARYSGVSGYCAATAEIEAETDIRLRRLWLAVDVGRVINPDGVINQVEADLGKTDADAARGLGAGGGADQSRCRIPRCGVGPRTGGQA
jgi:hypothetical protein